MAGIVLCMNAIQKLRQVVTEIQTAKEPPVQTWALAGRLLQRMPVDQKEAQRICLELDTAALDAIVTTVENPQPAPENNDADAVANVTAQDMTAALRAFKKRLKLTRLGDESKLGGRHLTAGHTSEVDAIIPPDDFPKAVWKALVKAEKLKYTGQGFYALP